MNPSVNWISHRKAASSIKDHLKTVVPKLDPQQITNQSQNILATFRKWACKYKKDAIKGRPQQRQYDRNALSTFLTPTKFPSLTGYKRPWPGDITIAITGVSGKGQVGFLTPITLPSDTLPTQKRIKALEKQVLQCCSENASLRRELDEANTELKEFKEKQAALSAQNSKNAKKNKGSRERLS